MVLYHNVLVELLVWYVCIVKFDEVIYYFVFVLVVMVNDYCMLCEFMYLLVLCVFDGLDVNEWILDCLVVYSVVLLCDEIERCKVLG